MCSTPHHSATNSAIAVVMRFSEPTCTHSSKPWRFSPGLLALLDAVRAHLFREAWWREHDEWLGPEVGHGPTSNTLEEIA